MPWRAWRARPALSRSLTVCEQTIASYWQRAKRLTPKGAPSSTSWDPSFNILKFREVNSE